MEKKKSKILTMPQQYIALLKQNNQNAPSIQSTDSNGDNNPFVNTIGDIVWSRFSPGVYYGTLAGAFPSGGKVLCDVGNNNENSGAIVNIKRQDDNTLVLTTTRLVIIFEGTEYYHEAQDNVLENETMVKIEVYP